MERTEVLKTLFVTPYLLFETVCALAQPTALPRYDAALMKETEAYLAAADKVLELRGDGYDLVRIGDHSRWGLDLIKRSDVFIGTGSPKDRLSSPYLSCLKAVYRAHEIWDSKLSYLRDPNKFNFDQIAIWTAAYRAERANCIKALPKPVRQKQAES